MAFYGAAKRVCVSIRKYGSNSAPENVNLIKQLRERTSAPMKDVKAALVDSNWDIEAAQKELRKRGKVLASKKSSRTATEGLLALAQSPTKLALIELNCETDFVARNDIFQHLALRLANQALSLSLDSSSAFHVGPQSLEDMPFNLDHPKFNGQTTVHNAITDVAAMMGENVRLRRGYVIPASPNGFISTYLHTSPQPGLGRIAGILSFQLDDGQTQVQALQRVGSELAMHVVAAKPLFLTKELVPSDALENEREILKSQAEASGKPKMAIEKMVEGRLRKYFEDVVFMDQKFIMNDTMNVKAVLDNLSKEVGSSVRVVDFLRMEVGEGIARTSTKSAKNGLKSEEKEQVLKKQLAPLAPGVAPRASSALESGAWSAMLAPGAPLPLQVGAKSAKSAPPAPPSLISGAKGAIMAPGAPCPLEFSATSAIFRARSARCTFSQC